MRRSEDPAIVQICSVNDLLVFGGSGVTIDRSGLGWAAMIESLLSAHVANDALRSYLVRNARELPSATIAEKMFFDASDPEDQPHESHQRIANHLRGILYSPGTWQKGRLAQSIADFLYVWTASSVRGKARRGAIVTTNYDDYLMRELRAAREKLEKRDVIVAEPVPRFPTVSDPLPTATTKLAEWTRDLDFMSAPGLSCIFLHGRIPSDPGEDSRFAVASERDYHRTALFTERTLKRLFERSNVLFVGTSLTDSPLIRALDETAQKAKGRKLQRWALMTAPDGENLPHGVTRAEVVRLLTKRMLALEVTPIFLDFPIQSAQFFHELSVCAEEKEPSAYLEYNASMRYGQRLCEWWRQWDNAKSARETEDRQRAAHELLRGSLEITRQILAAPSGERLKLEVWLRWDPYRSRKLRLWCSSVGTWTQGDSMRDGEIVTDGHYLAVKAFRSGRPEFGVSQSRRWKAYIAAPVWFELPDKKGSMAVGVVTIASMGSLDENSLDPQQNSANISKVLAFMQALGDMVADPSSYLHSGTPD